MAEKTAGGEEADSAVTTASKKKLLRRNSLFNKPSWLLCTIADLDERIKQVTLNSSTEDNVDSFSARANFYYEERPQLLALLQDLYNACLSLADRYCRELSKNHRPYQYSSPVPQLKFDDNGQIDGEAIDSDAESSLSFHGHDWDNQIDRDMIVVDLVMRNVDCEFVLNELRIVENRWNESLKKIELQQNLLDVLESERLILLNDNATLEYRITSLVEENKGLALESLSLKRKAAELAQCLFNMREDHRVCMLSRKIEDLQGQVYGLEKRNKEYQGYFVKQDKNTGKEGHGGKQVSLEDCLQIHRGGSYSLGKCLHVPRGGSYSLGKCLHVPRGGSTRLGKCFSADLQKDNQKVNHKVEGGRVSKFWGRIKKFDLLVCGPYLNPTYC